MPVDQRPRRANGERHPRRTAVPRQRRHFPAHHIPRSLPATNVRRPRRQGIGDDQPAQGEGAVVGDGEGVGEERAGGQGEGRTLADTQVAGANDGQRPHGLIVGRVGVGAIGDDEGSRETVRAGEGQGQGDGDGHLLRRKQRGNGARLRQGERPPAGDARFQPQHPFRRGEGAGIGHGDSHHWRDGDCPFLSQHGGGIELCHRRVGRPEEPFNQRVVGAVALGEGASRPHRDGEGVRPLSRRCAHVGGRDGVARPQIAEGDFGAVGHRPAEEVGQREAGGDAGGGHIPPIGDVRPHRIGLEHAAAGGRNLQIHVGGVVGGGLRHKRLPDDGQRAVGVEEVAAVFEVAGRGVVVGGEPGPHLHQPPAVGWQAGGRVAGGQHHVEHVGQELGGDSVAETGVTGGGQHAELGDDEGDVAVAAVVHPLAELAQVRLHRRHVQQILRGELDLPAGVAAAEGGDARAPVAVFFVEDVKVNVPQVGGEGFAVGGLVVRQHLVQILHAQGGGLDDGGHGDFGGRVGGLDGGVEVVVQFGVQLGLDGTAVVDGVRFVAHQPQRTGMRLHVLHQPGAGDVERHLRGLRGGGFVPAANGTRPPDVEVDGAGVLHAAGMARIAGRAPVHVPARFQHGGIVVGGFAVAHPVVVRFVGGEEEVAAAVLGVGRGWGLRSQGDVCQSPPQHNKQGAAKHHGGCKTFYHRLGVSWVRCKETW